MPQGISHTPTPNLFWTRLTNATLVLCAVLVTATAVYRTFFAARSAATPPPSGPAGSWYKIDNWSQVVSAPGHLLGDSLAPIRIVEFADYQCGYCRVLAGTLDSLRAKLPQQIAVVFHDFPLSGHRYARTAANVAACAAEQGKFEEVHQLLFELQDSLGILSWEDIGQRVGVPSMAQFNNCVTNEPHGPAIDADLATGRRLALQGTPAIAMNGYIHVGALPLAELETQVGLLLSANPRRGRSK
jgi:protein-disulfide isomerase